LLYYLLVRRPAVKEAVWWFTYPLLYVLATLVRGLFDGYYPYWFLTPYGRYLDGIGSFINVVLIAIVIGLIYFGLGTLLWFLNKKIRMR
jgi:hypothetical protein